MLGPLAAGLSGPMGMHFLCMGAACIQHSRAIAMSMLLPVRASQLQAKGPEDAPCSFSLLSLPFPLPFSMSQMAILLTASKKALHSTAHMCPEMFVDLSESQPCPRLKSRPLSPFRSGTVQPLRAESIFKSSQHTTPCSQALSFPSPRALAAL